MLNRLFQQTCRTHGDRPALLFGNQRFSYAQLEELVARCAASLGSLGAAPGYGVAMVLKNSPEFIVAFLAAARVGAPAFLMDSGSKTSELQRLFAENRIATAVCEPEQMLSIEHLRAETQQHFPIYPRAGGILPWLGPGTEPPTRLYEDEIAIVQYTSGTTGGPKCTARSQRNLACEAANFNATTHATADDRVLCTVPLYHAHGFANAFLAALYAGAALVIVDEFNRSEVLELIRRERVTILPGVPFMFDLLGQRAPEASGSQNSLRLVFSAGAPLPAEVADNFQQAFGVYVRQLYGTTEVGSAAINLDPDVWASLDSVGLPMKNVRIEIFREDGSIASAGEEGEVAIQSPAMPEGYLRQPELSRQKFHDGFFWPGDVGHRNERGYLYIRGRAPWLVSSAGRKVDPLEVEAVIVTLPKVREAIVVGAPGPFGENIVKAVVVARESCTEQEIIDYCRDRLADFKVPRLVEFVGEIPRNSSGKVQRGNFVS